MCKAKVSAPDTRAQDAEAQRQNQLLLQQAEQRRVDELSAAERRRAEEQARYDAMLAEQRTQAEAERARMDALVEQQRQDSLAAEARRQAEAEAVRKETEERAARVRQYSDGRQAQIDQYNNDLTSAFAGFDDSFFNQFKNDYIASAKPGLEQQYQDENKKLVYAFANSGNLDSTAAADRFGRLEQLRADREARVGDLAEQSAQGLRTSVDQTKSDSLAAAFASGAVGNETLPDGVTDVSGELSRVGANLSALAASARKKAGSISGSKYDTSNLSDLTLDFAAPSTGSNTYGRFGGSSGINSAKLGRSSYVVS